MDLALMILHLLLIIGALALPYLIFSAKSPGLTTFVEIYLFFIMFLEGCFGFYKEWTEHGYKFRANTDLSNSKIGTYSIFIAVPLMILLIVLSAYFHLDKLFSWLPINQ